jgi:hypothetical protein
MNSPVIGKHRGNRMLASFNPDGTGEWEASSLGFLNAVQPRSWEPPCCPESSGAGDGPRPSETVRASGNSFLRTGHNPQDPVVTTLSRDSICRPAASP